MEDDALTAAERRLLIDILAEEFGVAFVAERFGDQNGEPEQARIREVAESVADAMVEAYRLEPRSRGRLIADHQAAEWEAQHPKDPDDLIALQLGAAFAKGRFGEGIRATEPESIGLVAGLAADAVEYAFRLVGRDVGDGEDASEPPARPSTP